MARQPQFLLPLNETLKLGFVIAPQFGGAVGRDLVTGARLASVGVSGSLKAAPGGLSLDYGAVGTKYPDYAAIPTFIPGTKDFAVAVSGVFQPGTTAGIALSNYVGGTSGTQWRMQPNWNGSSIVSGAFCFMTYDGVTFVNAGANGIIVAGEYATLLGVRRGSTVELWKNGRLVASGTGTAHNINTNSSIGFGWSTGYNYTAGGTRNLGFGLLNTIPPGLANSLSANPWQIFQSPPIDIWVPSAGGSLDITATLGTATADGFNATIDRQLAIAATLGTATAAGFPATIDRQLAIAATFGTATADGLTATVTLGNDLNIATTLGAATADGFNATVDRQLAIAALLGTATANGFAATVTFGNDLNISATLGIAAADGFNANIDRQLTIAALLGQSVADGFTATISSGGGMTLTAADLAAIDALLTAQLPNIAAVVLAAYVEGTTTIQQSLRISNAVLAGKVSGAGTGTETFRDLANTKDRIVATVDSSGNRTAIIRDLS